MDEIGEVIRFVKDGSVGFFAIVLILIFFPEKVETWVALIWRFFGNCGFLVKTAKQRYIRHDLQGRVNSFLKSLHKEGRFLTHKRVNLEWIDSENTTRASFLRDDKLIIRLRRDDPHEQNFVHSAFLFISTSFLPKTKQYLSSSQRKAVDLFVTGKLLESQKPSAVNFYLAQYLHPETEKSKLRGYFDQFATIDAHGFFYPVFLQELDFLGNKVFGRIKSSTINKEFNDLSEFLSALSFRVVGDNNTPLSFDGAYCRFHVLIVGRRLIVEIDPEGQIYLNHLRNNQFASKADTIYLMGAWDNRNTINNIARKLSSTHDAFPQQRIQVKLHFQQGNSQMTDNCLVVLRRKGVPIFEASNLTD